LSITLRVNGAERRADSEPTATLVSALRSMGLTGTKEGCSTGACGACSVLVDGDLVYGCLRLVGAADGAEILTIEGLGTADDLHPLQQGFIDAGAVQCGFCIPGMIMAAKSLLDRVADPSESEIRHALSGNICRCTGYVKIVEAVRLAAQTR